MSETGEGLNTNEIVNKKKSSWVDLDKTSIDNANNYLKGKTNFRCIPQAISFSHYERDTVLSLQEMLNNDMAGKLFSGESDINYGTLQTSNQDGSNLDIMFVCEPEIHDKALKSIDKSVGRVNNLLKNIDSKIRLPVRPLK